MTDCRTCEHYKVEHTGTETKPGLRIYCARKCGAMMMCAEDCPHFELWKRDYDGAEPQTKK